MGLRRYKSRVEKIKCPKNCEMDDTFEVGCKKFGTKKQGVK